MTMHLRTSVARCVLGFCVLGGALSRPSDGAEWSRFRGPNGTGTVDDKNVPVEWTAESVLWKTAVPGKGNSSPVVWGNRLFLQSASADGTQRWLICLDAASGRELWKQTAPGAPATIHKRNSFASCTPAVDGECVYAVVWDGKDLSLFAYDMDGRLKWRQNLGGFRSQHGAGHSPIIFDGKVILADDQDGSAVLLAFDAKTGKPAWKVERRAFRACYSTPIILERPNERPQLIVASTAGITGYAPKDGRVIWDYTWSFVKMPLRMVASPVIADGHVIANSGDGSGERNQIAVRLGGTGDVTNTHLAWQVRKDSAYVPCLVAHGPYVFSVNDFGVASCTVAKTGAKLWSERVGGDTSASPVLIDGKIFTVDMAGKVSVFEAGPKFKLLARNDVGEPVMGSPAVAEGRLFIRGQEHLFCIGKPPAK